MDLIDGLLGGGMKVGFKESGEGFCRYQAAWP